MRRVPSKRVPSKSAADFDAAPGLVLIGAGGHAMVVAEAAAMAGFLVLGAYDDASDAVAFRLLRVKRLGSLRDFKSGPFILALGDLPLRRRTLKGLKAHAARVIHPLSILHASARVGDGVYVGPAAVVHTFARIDPHAIINSGAIVEHECQIGENAHIAPGAVLGGRVRVGADTLVGLGARVLPNLSIGKGCTIGAGAVVVGDVPDRATVAGVPACRV